MKSWGIFLAIALSGVISKADITPQAEKRSCASYDLRGPVLGDVLNQGQTGWCFGFTASDMLTNLTGKRISPVPTTMSYVKDLSDFGRSIRSMFAGSSVAGGYVAKAVEKAAEEGLCLEENYTMSAYSPSSIADAASNKQLDTKTLCEKREQPFELKVQQTGLPDGDRGYAMMANTINGALSKGRIVGMEYAVGFILGERGGWHVSSIVGQRYKDNQCEVLIRNSWGKSCDDYVFPCENGNIWVPRKKLQDKIMKLVTIEKK